MAGSGRRRVHRSVDGDTPIPELSVHKKLKAGRLQSLMTRSSNSQEQEQSSIEERIGKTGNELDEIRLAGGLGLREQAVQVGLDRGLADVQCLSNLCDAADFDDC